MRVYIKYKNEMKAVYLFLFILVLIPIQVCNAQVGINTEPKPGTILHLKTNDGDVIVNSNTGNLGINTDNPTEKLHVNGNSKVIGNTNVEQKIMVNGKTQVDGSVTNVKTPEHIPSAALEIVKDPTNPNLPTGKIEGGGFADGHVLTADSAGNATWTPLRPEFKIVGIDENGDLLPLYDDQAAAGARKIWIPAGTLKNITHNPLTLDKGRWLILAKYSTRRYNSPATSPDMLYTQLKSYPAEPGRENEIRVETTFGIQPEQSGYSVCLPTLFYITYVEETRVFNIYSMPVGNGVDGYSDRGGTYFCAIKLSDN